jgi:hypothetical protein
MPEPSFNKQDVWDVATGLLKDCYAYDVECGRNAYNKCRHCGRSVYWNEPAHTIEHELSCVVLKATDLLTGMENHRA